uniref:Uncharacterized protein n=1 Tax=Setaria italica TaxID=4555 RepID=K4AH37_SETIT
MRRSICSPKMAHNLSNNLPRRALRRSGSSGASMGKKADTFGKPTATVNSSITPLNAPTRRGRRRRWRGYVRVCDRDRSARSECSSFADFFGGDLDVRES